MSRRHHGRPHHHAHGATEAPRRAAGVSPAESSAPTQRPVVPQVPSDASRPVDPVPSVAPRTNGAPQPAAAAPAFVPHADANAVVTDEHRQVQPPTQHAPAQMATNGAPTGMNGMNGGANAQCTAPQLRRFIKSRPYVPMHELRRRFGIDGDDDDVTPVRLDPGWVYVGLPGREGGLLGELLKAGEIGYELSLDPRTPIVIGVYPMRPIPRG